MPTLGIVGMINRGVMRTTLTFHRSFLASWSGSNTSSLVRPFRWIGKGPSHYIWKVLPWSSCLHVLLAPVCASYEVRCDITFYFKESLPIRFPTIPGSMLLGIHVDPGTQIPLVQMCMVVKGGDREPQIMGQESQKQRGTWGHRCVERLAYRQF